MPSPGASAAPWGTYRIPSGGERASYLRVPVDVAGNNYIDFANKGVPFRQRARLWPRFLDPRTTPVMLAQMMCRGRSSSMPRPAPRRRPDGSIAMPWSDRHRTVVIPVRLKGAYPPITTSAGV